MRINKKKFIYLISPLKINKFFYTDLTKVLKLRKVSFFQLRIKKESFKKKLIIGKKIKKICKRFNVKFLINDEILLYQTMLYFKPPGARGQGLHQDHQYIREYPLIGVWLALDDCDKENGQMMVIPKSNKLGLQEVEETDMTKSFTTGQSVIPKNSNIIGADINELAPINGFNSYNFLVAKLAYKILSYKFLY